MYTRLYATPVHPWVYPVRPLHLGVPVPPYTGVALPVEEALGSNPGIMLGERLPRASGLSDVLQLLDSDAQSCSVSQGINV